MDRQKMLDLVVTFKTETNLNLRLLHSLQPLPSKIAQQIFDERGLEKLTQNLFIHISYYLISIIDPQTSLTWPLYDSAGERAYRNELSTFVSKNAVNGSLTSVPSSYFVQPSCFKVTYLCFQLSKLAVKHMLTTRIADDKKVLYDTITEKFENLKGTSFTDHMKELRYEDTLYGKLTVYLSKKQQYEEIAKCLRNKINKNERLLSVLKPNEYIAEIVDGFVSQYELDEQFKKEVLEIKNVDMPAKIFDDWLEVCDKNIDTMETEWSDKAATFIGKCRRMRDLTEAIACRYAGLTEKSSYTLEYDPKKDAICTDELQSQVNSEQKFILKNLQNDGRLNFPNLVRSFLISVCFILKNNVDDGHIYRFSEQMQEYGRNFREARMALEILMEKLSDAENKVQPAPVNTVGLQECLKKYLNIPELPDLSNLKMKQDQYSTILDTYTPLSLCKHQFNLCRTTSEFAKPHPRQLYTHAPKDDFMKTLTSCRLSSFDHSNTSRSSHNMSVISNIKANETIAGCSSGFTRQQIMKLLSTKKSSTKKTKYKAEQRDARLKHGLFNESIMPNDSNNLFRSYSSPNLSDNRGRSYTGVRGRQLSIMHEDLSQFELSGIARLDSNYNSPAGSENGNEPNTESSVQIMDNLTNKSEYTLQNNCIQNGFNDGQDRISVPEPPRLFLTPPSVSETLSSSIETPKMVTLFKNTGSVEKIIDRFRKIQACIHNKNADIQSNKAHISHCIIEEKEYLQPKVFSPNRSTVPDLLKSSCNNYLDGMSSDDEEHKKLKKPSRQSLGALLGVDYAFLDQYDLSE